ncbi:MAG: uncharacterized protein JWQ57_2588 [Mucilaginibacter sp.]|nr:uncharacterized protein [Mucilaginibacter sp.]
MTSEEIDYIITHLSNLISEPELIALKHHFYADSVKESDLRKKWYLERKMITEDPEILKLLDDGYEQLRSRAAENALKSHPGEVFFNRCKICGKPARTPFAKQCRFCGHDWH